MFGRNVQDEIATHSAILGDPFGLVARDAPRARIICATVHPGRVDPRLAGFAPADVAGCDLDQQIALRRCEGEAIEYLAQLSPPGDPLRNGGDMVTARDLSTGGLAQMPAELCLRMLANQDQAGLGSGCAAGQTLDDAILSGLWELIERDAICRWWHEGTPAHAPDVAWDEPTRDYVAQLRTGAADPDTRLLDISTRAGLPVLVAISTDTQTGGFVAGMGAHPHPLVAAKKALRELVQMEAGRDLARFKVTRGMPLGDADRRILRRAATPGDDLPALSAGEAAHGHTPVTGDAAALLAATLRLLAMPLFAVNLTRAAFQLAVAKVVAPQLRTIPDEIDWVAAAPEQRLALF